MEVKPIVNTHPIAKNMDSKMQSKQFFTNLMNLVNIYPIVKTVKALKH